MANLSFTSNNQIIRDLYPTAAEAINAARAMGCDGYRTYLINGITQYVPCSSYVQYENAMRWKKVQGVVGAFGSDSFGDKLVGLQFANSKDEIQGDPYFTLGNFSINLPSSAFNPNLKPISIQTDAVRKYTIKNIVNRNLSYFEGKPAIDTLKQLVTKNLSVNVLFDPRKLDNYVLFSSLKERMKNTLVEIYNSYPAAIKLQPISIMHPTVSQYVTFVSENRAELKVNLHGMSNPFGVEYTVTGTTVADNEIITPHRNFSKKYKDYVLTYNGVDYPIVAAVLPKNLNDITTGIRLTVSGDPFSAVADINGDANISFYIRPKDTVLHEFYKNLSDLATFLLRIDANSGKYTSEFLFPALSDNGIIVNTKQVVFFPKFDDYNLDMFSSLFDDYTTTLNDLADSYDSVKTNLISRFLTTDSLREFDTPERKANLTFQLYGRQFDQVKKFIDGITFMNNVSYNKVENIPDLLIKNFAHMLGFETYEIEDENTLIESLFSLKDTTLSTGLTPVEMDIELWRRILINAAYLFKSKGTRKSIEFILKLVGFPDEIFDLNEYVYLAERPLNPADTLNKLYVGSDDDPTMLLSLQPFDSEGYPTVPLNVVYQEAGGYIYENKSHIGPYDFGKTYINQFKKSGNGVRLFEMERTIDNRKSWAVNTSIITRLFDDVNGYTEYESKDTRLTINTKEFEVYLGSDRILDVCIYRQYMRNLGMVNADLNFSRSFDATQLTFKEFLKKSLNNFIDPSTHKTTKGYPTLTKVYFDYLAGTTNPMDNQRTLQFLSTFDTHWVKLVEQFVPATTIVNAGNKVQNSAFVDNKFEYKHGQNDDVSWLGTDGSEFQQKALRPVLLATTSVKSHQGKVRVPLVGNTPSFAVTGKKGTKVTAVDDGVNRYFGFEYSMLDFCDESEGGFEIWKAGINYADDSTYGGNINLSGYTINTPRYGVFAYHAGNVYRLNTCLIFSGATVIETTGVTASGTPNIATITYSGETKKIWEKINMNVDSRTVTFEDSAVSGITTNERSYYMNSIGKAMAFANIGIVFDCPPPKPHVCYFDYAGQPINFSTYSGATYASFTDETATVNKVRQSRYYGYSKDTATVRPSKTALGYKNNWAVPYKKAAIYICEGVGTGSCAPVGDKHTLYAGDLVHYIRMSGSTVTSDTYYEITGDTLSFSDSNLVDYPYFYTYISGVTSGVTTTSTTVTGGTYEDYHERTITDPFMQVSPAFIKAENLNPVSTVYSVNLSKALNLKHIFSGLTSATTFVANANVVDDQLFISDSVSLAVDGLYSVAPGNVGPFYTLKDENIFLHTLVESLPLIVNKHNYISIQSLNDNFLGVGNDLSLAKTNPGYYLITKNSFLSFNFNLYFESSLNIGQSVRIRLVNQFQYVYNEDVFTFNGSNTPDTRQYYFQYHGFFSAGDKIYLTIMPVDQPCVIARYETIDYAHTEVDPSIFNQLNDPRFRVLLNSGNVTNRIGLIGEGLSVKPIYNLNDFNTKQLMLEVNADRYVDTRIPSIAYSTDESYTYNKIFGGYYSKFAQGQLIQDTRVYDKLLNNDKIDFSFKVRSKNPNIATSGAINVGGQTIAIGTQSTSVSYDISIADFYLGNTPKQTEYNNVSNTISIGKNARRRLSNHLKTVNYIPTHSFYDGVALGSGTTISGFSFTGYDDGLADYTQLNYSGDIMADQRIKRRVHFGVPGTTGTTALNYYQEENEAYNTDIYRAIFAKVPEFNPQIINYELNDIVKVLQQNAKVVSGTTLVTKDTFRLYVCVNDTHPSHCYNQNGVIGELHPIYRPMGARSCFVPIEKYNPANFTPWGYEENMVRGLPNPNMTDYVYQTIKTFSDTSPFDYEFGDVIIANNNNFTNYYRYIYQKPTTYNTGVTYSPGAFVMGSQPSGSTTVYRYFYSVNGSTNVAPSTGSTTEWTMLSSQLFNHKSYSSTSLVDAGLLGASGVTTYDFTIAWFGAGSTIHFDGDSLMNYSSTAARMPKTLPVTTGGTPGIVTGSSTGYTFDGVVYGDRWNRLLQPDSVYIDLGYSNPDTYEVINDLKIVRNRLATGTTSVNGVTMDTWAYYKGVTTGLAPAYDGTVETDSYLDNYNKPRTGNTNIFLKPALPNDTTLTTGYFIRPVQGEAENVLPLFEWMCQIDEKNNPNLWTGPSVANTIYYDKSSLYMGQKYAVDRGVLYQYINDTAVVTPSGLTTSPYNDAVNWTEKDFCLVSNFTFYKDRTRVEVYEATIESITTGMSSQFYFFNSNKTYKTGFTAQSFSGSTVDLTLRNGAEKFAYVSQTTETEPTKYGTFDFQVKGEELIMDYTFEKDLVGYPITGEFMGKLSIVNPCGQTATTYFGILFDTDVVKLNRSSRLDVAPIAPPSANNTIISPYAVRVVVNQSSNATADVAVVSIGEDSQQKSDNFVINKYTTFDRRFAVNPSSEITIYVSYSTVGKQTSFKSAAIDNFPIYVNGILTNTNNLVTSITKNQSTGVETRAITLKNIQKSATVYVNLIGVENLDSAVLTNSSSIFSVKNIVLSGK